MTEHGVKTISIVMLIILISKIAGLIRNTIVISFLGTGYDHAAAFHFASVIPQNFLDVAFAAAISASFIPVYNNFIVSRGRQKADLLANNFNTTILIAAAIVTLLGFFLSGFIASFLGEEYPNAVEIATTLLRIFMFTIFITTTTFSITGIVQSLGEFNMPAAMSLIFNMVVILYTLFFFERWGVFGLAIAFIVGNILQVMLLLPSLRKKNFKLKFYINLKDEGLLQILRLTPMALITSWLFPISNMINIFILTSYNLETIGQHNAANSLYIVITGFFVLSITNVLFPKLSKDAAKDIKGFVQTLSKALSGMMFLLIPMSVGLWFLASPLIVLAYERVAFTTEDSIATAASLRFFALGMFGFGLQTLLSRGFFAVMDTKSPLIISFLAIIINIIVVFTTLNYFGVAAAALAVAVSINFAGICKYIVMARRYKGFFTSKILLNLIKMLVAAFIMAAFIYIINAVLPPMHDIFKVTIIVFTGIIVYFAMSFLLKIQQIQLITTFFERYKNG